MTYADGSAYCGEWQDDMRWGTGELTRPGGHIQLGQWHADQFVAGTDLSDLLPKRHSAVPLPVPVPGPGPGTVQPQMIDADNGILIISHARLGVTSTFVGNVVNGLAHGVGTCVFTDGSTYSGEWAANQRSGAGQMVWADGASYAGNWHADRRAGMGVLVRADGVEQVGEWFDDRFVVPDGVD
jgi:hypothetical protein